ncbi:MAG: phage tail sheath family protein [Pseudomonadales bacterium]
MPEYLAPGVFIEEIERGPKPIEGVATSTAAFLGECARGPVLPTLITSYSNYLRLFGSVFGPGNYMPYAVKSFFDNGGRRCYITRISGDNAVASSAVLGAFTFTARGPGLLGDRTWVQVEDSTTQDGNGPIGFRIRVFYWDKLPPGAVVFDPVANPDQLPRPSISEDFDDLTTDPSHPDYFDKRVNNGNSALIEIAVPDFTPPPGGTTQQALANGDDGNAINITNYQGNAANVNDRRGLAALNLDKYRDVAIVYAPAVADDIAVAVIAHCESNRFRFAVIDSPANAANAANLDPRSQATPLNSQFAAYYYPWVVTSDPATGQRTTIPPGGIACGIYARTDNTRGVFKAPANEKVIGALDLEFDIDHGTQEVLNPRGVNCIRRFPGRGIRIWGARTLASDPLWKYVSVRRLFIFLEASIYQATQWVVFEPNDQRLWNRVKQTVTLFLRTQWREGALFGAKEEEAFIVNVGRETMTEDDILNGRLIVELGIAPVRPAEFVIFRVYQKTQEAGS